MTTEKLILIRLFFNTSENTAFIQIGEDSLFKIPVKVAARLQEKEQIEMTHVASVKEAQIICHDLNKNSSK